MSRLHRSGPGVIRVLLVGGEVLASGGAGLSAAEELADVLHSSRGAGVDLDVLWELPAALAAMTSLSEPWRTWPYDAVVVLLPLLLRSPAGGRPRGARDDVLKRVVEQLQSFTRLAVVELPPRPGSYARHRRPLTSGQTHVTALPGDVPLPIALGGVFAELMPAVASNEHSDWRGRAQDETARQGALSATQALQSPLDRGLARVVAAARDAFGLDGVMVNLLDADQLWTVAAAGAPVGRQPRHGTLCDQTIRTAGVTVFEDTWAVGQFDGNPIMHGPTPLRFYAGHPIESVEGYRIGTLCVYDRDPHDRAEFDFSMLRDLALLAEAEVLDAARHRVAIGAEFPERG